MVDQHLYRMDAKNIENLYVGIMYMLSLCFTILLEWITSNIIVYFD